jgi:hypothetical protein
MASIVDDVGGPIKYYGMTYFKFRLNFDCDILLLDFGDNFETFT